MVAMYPTSDLHTETSSHPSIKILDLLTNRYHAGVVHAALADGGWEIEVPTTARLRPGQRIHFAIDDATGLMARRAMRSGLVRQASPSGTSHVRINLAAATETLAA